MCICLVGAGIGVLYMGLLLGFVWCTEFLRCGEWDYIYDCGAASICV